MQSIISMISVNNNLDVAPLDDLEDIPDIESLSGDISEHVLDFTQQLEQLTSSLTGGGSELPTPISGEFGGLLFNSGYVVGSDMEQSLIEWSGGTDN